MVIQQSADSEVLRCTLQATAFAVTWALSTPYKLCPFYKKPLGLHSSHLAGVPIMIVVSKGQDEALSDGSQLVAAC